MALTKIRGGARTGAGRPKGSLNAVTIQLHERLRQLKCEPFHIMALTALGTMECGVCWGKGRTNYAITRKCKQCVEGVINMSDVDALAPAECIACQGLGKLQLIRERICQSCYGTLREKISPDLRYKAASDLAEYVGAKRKAVEVSGPDGKEVPMSLTVEFVVSEEQRERRMGDKKYKTLEHVAQALEAGAQVPLEQCDPDLPKTEMPVAEIGCGEVVRDENGEPVLPPDFPPMEWK